MKRLPAVVSAVMVAGLAGAAPAAPAGPVAVVPTSFAATLTGTRDSTAVAVVTVTADRVVFALRWSGFVPEYGHLHEGDGEGDRRTGASAGKKPPAKVRLFGSAMPDTVRAAAGQVALDDAGLARRILANPSGWTVDLHGARLPGGSVAGRLAPLRRSIGPLTARKATGAGTLRALASGGQEVPKSDPSKVGDPDGQALAELRPDGTAIDYGYAWLDIQSPSKGHLHKGVPGRNGDVVFDFFDRPVPDGIFAVSGRLEGLDRATVNRVRDNPRGYYANLHTAEFPDGAVRGQLA
ncbi:CHRD domain-containing protein [Streptomyces sp. SCSIO 30461]|uniref:CHRD domain-containing protein n=1 Tax=Streptomyces sp. SCSIO 30461 TaxID=3118085 RepID=UPI0030CF4D4E